MAKKVTFHFKDIEMGLKRGVTTANFAAQYECSEEEFVAAIKRLFTRRAAEDVIRRLKNNDKEFDKAMRQLKKGKPSSVAMATVEKAEEANSAQQKTPELDELTIVQELAGKISEAICANETLHRNLLANRRGIYDNLRAAKAELAKIQEQIRQKQQHVESCFSKIDILNAQISDINAERAALKADLSELQLQIKELERVEILCLADGRIECSVAVPADWRETFELLTSDEEAEDELKLIKEMAEEISMKQVKQLAKISALIESLKEQETGFKLVFDNETEVSSILELLDIEVFYK